MDWYQKTKDELKNGVGLSSEAASNIQKKIRTEKANILYQNLQIAIPANFVCATIVFSALYQGTHNALTLGWYLTFLLFSIARMGMLYIYHRLHVKVLSRQPFIVASAILSALLWAFVEVLLLPHQTLLEQMIVLIVIVVITAGGIQALQANIYASICYLFIIIFPLAVWFFLQNSLSHIIVGITLIVYLVYMLLIAWRGHRILNQILDLEYRNYELLENLAASNSKLQQSYNAIEEREKTLTTIQENAPIGMGIVDLDGKWVEVNRALSQILGYSKNELQSLELTEIVYGEDLAIYRNALKKFLTTKLGSLQFEIRLIHKTGRSIWALVNISILRNSEGLPKYFISQIQDISEQKINEKKVHELNSQTNSILKELQQRDYEMAFINNMNEMLQTCQESQEAYKVIDQAAQALFKNFSGGLVIIDKVNNVLQTITQWGPQNLLKEKFSLEDCWGLREGHLYLVKDSTQALLCKHFAANFSGSSLCLPMIVNSGVIGLLVLCAPVHSEITPYQQQLAITLCEDIKLFLKNIKLRESLQEQSIRDALTGLFNRRYADETLPRELKRAIREKKNVSVAMIDIDFFKHFNDVNGHAAGDEVLKSVARILQKSFRESDVVCRFGGEEFLIILVDTSLHDALARLQSVREEIKYTQISFNGQTMPPITISGGIAEAPAHAVNAEDIIRCADDALYSAKKSGRDRIEMFNTVS